MAVKETIHHPELGREAKVGPGFAKALIREGGWKKGPLKKSASSSATKTTAAKKTTASKS